MNLGSSDKIRVTILTPTYNRAYILPKLYESLIYQSSKQFIWLIVDDGSNDNTKKIVEKFNTDDFLIKYIYKKNGGKHTAINLGMKYVNTDYTFIVDSDDYLVNNAIELINGWIEEIEGMPKFAGIAGIKVYDGKDYKKIGQFPKGCEYIDCLNSERKQKKLLGDKAEIYKTELLKQNPFSEYQNEKFIPESVIWNRFSILGLKVRWHKEEIEVSRYLEDGLTQASRDINHFKDNFKGYREDCNVSLKALKFPYNYSAASVYYARCIVCGCTQNCMEEFKISILQKMIIIFIGKVRYKIGRY